MEIFHWYDINLENDDSLDFEDLLEIAVILVGRRKFLADLLWDRGTYLVDKYAEPQEKAFITPNNVESFIHLTPTTQL